jgi:hypothetical protein
MWIIAIVLLGLWLLGMFLKFTIKGLLHIFLLVAVVIILARLFLH